MGRDAVTRRSLPRSAMFEGPWSVIALLEWLCKQPALFTGLSTTWVWWGTMVAVAVFNIWFLIHEHSKTKLSSDPATRRYQSTIMWLSVPFVVECAYRSVFPSLYNERQVFFDTMFNSILVDRTLAAVGEVCW